MPTASSPHAERRVRPASLLSLILLTPLVIVACRGAGDAPTGPSALTGTRTYYVAINQTGADNVRCDGSSPTDLGGGRCPFKDFQSDRTFRLVNGVANVRLVVRQGVYRFVNEGLSITGTGASSAEAVSLEAYSGEEVVFDGDDRLRETLRVSGQFVIVRGITFDRSAGYHLEVRGGRQVRITENRFRSNNASDALKGTDGASDVEVLNNDFTQWASQAIDLTGAARWTISGNTFHDSQRGTGPLGAKLGTREVRFAENRIRDAGGIALGGTSAPHPNAYEAYDLVAEHNVFERVAGHAVTFYSCRGCRFSNNDVTGAQRGVRLGGALFQGGSGCEGGCRPSTQTTVRNNRFRDLTGDGQAPPGLFWLVDPADRDGLTAAENLYCADSNQSARFAIAPSIVDFLAWTRAVQTDTTSVLTSRSDPRCQGW